MMASMRVVDLVTTDGNKKYEPAGRMATVIIQIIQKSGSCSPQDLTAFGFTEQETIDLWHIANAMADIEIKFMDRRTTPNSKQSK
jgi:hypothetical protein